MKQSKKNMLDPREWNPQVFPKRRLLSANLHCVTFQKSQNLSYIATEAWNQSVCWILFSIIPILLNQRWYNTVAVYVTVEGPALKVKVKVKFRVKVKCSLVQALRLCTDRTAHGVSRGIALLFLSHGTRKVARGQLHAPAALYPRERPSTHCTGGWVGPKDGLERCGKSRLNRDSIPGPSSL